MAEFFWWLWQFIWRHVRFFVDITIIGLPLAIFVDYVFPNFTAAHHVGVMIALALIGYNFHRAVIHHWPDAWRNNRIDD